MLTLHASHSSVISRYFFLLISTLVSIAFGQAKAPAPGTMLTTPLEITREDLNFVGQEGLLFVPENRSAKDSRTISVHFFHFPAQQKSDLAPVFILPGGPGGSYSVRSFYRYYGGERAKAWTTELTIMNQKRDIVIVNQRGNSNAPGLTSSEWRWRVKPIPLNEPLNLARTAKQYQASIKEQVAKWQKKGVDLAGYDIINIVDDLEDLRNALGFNKIALRGNSFGSQWSLSYLKRWPDNVDRILITGVEPLDHAYDSPQDLWKALERLEAYARNNKTFGPTLPETGLLEIFKSLLKRLDAQPAAVEIEHPEEEGMANMAIGADDIRDYITGRIYGDRRETLRYWPKYLLELENADYRFIASQAAEDRPDTYAGPMIGALIDNSLGISKKREAKLMAEPATQWLGNRNRWYMASREVTPTPVVDDEFRLGLRTDVPVLMIQGDLDFSTPYENALELMPSLKNGHLVTVKGGTHSVSKELFQFKEDIARQIFEFMNANFDDTTPHQLFSTLPKTVSLPTIDFIPLDSKSLYERLIEND